MDGTLAVLFLFTGLIDMWVNHCDTGCVKPVATVARQVASVGRLIFEADSIGTEAYYRHDLPISFGPFQPAIGASVDSLGDVWIGLGAVNAFHLWGKNSFAQFSFMPGLWLRGNGPVLGHAVEFRSGIDAGYEHPNGMRYSISLDHRSNGDIVPTNPGLETLQLRISVPAE